jgi:hypothetical protein
MGRCQELISASKHCSSSVFVCVEIGIVNDASGAYRGQSPRSGRKGVISGIMLEDKSNEMSAHDVQEVIR